MEIKQNSTRRKFTKQDLILILDCPIVRTYSNQCQGLAAHYCSSKLEVRETAIVSRYGLTVRPSCTRSRHQEQTNTILEDGVSQLEAGIRPSCLNPCLNHAVTRDDLEGFMSQKEGFKSFIATVSPLRNIVCFLSRYLSRIVPANWRFAEPREPSRNRNSFTLCPSG